MDLLVYMALAVLNPFSGLSNSFQGQSLLSTLASDRVGHRLQMAIQKRGIGAGSTDWVWRFAAVESSHEIQGLAAGAGLAAAPPCPPSYK